MADIKVLNNKGEETEEIALSDDIFSIEPNIPVMHACVVNYLANRRSGTQSTLTRTEVSGGGKKPWRQKGTGRARQGSTRAPQWRHGGVALGPKPRSYRYTINKKVRRLGMKSAFSSKYLDGELIVLDSFGLEEIKTKEAAKVLSAIGAGKKTLIVVPEKDDVLYKSARNIEGVKISLVNTLNVYDMLNCDKMVLLKESVAKIEEVYQ